MQRTGGTPQKSAFEGVPTGPRPVVESEIYELLTGDLRSCAGDDLSHRSSVLWQGRRRPRSGQPRRTERAMPALAGAASGEVSPERR